MTAPLRRTDPAARTSTLRVGSTAGGALTLSFRRWLIWSSDRIQDSVFGDVIGVIAIFAITGGFMVIAAGVTP